MKAINQLQIQTDGPQYASCCLAGSATPTWIKARAKGTDVSSERQKITFFVAD